MCVTVAASNKGDRCWLCDLKMAAQKANARDHIPSHFFAHALAVLSLVVYSFLFETNWPLTQLP